ILDTELTSKHTQNQFKKKVKKNNKGGKTHWRLAGRCPLGVSVCRRHWNCVSMASGYELTRQHTQNQFEKKIKKKGYLCMYLFVYLFINIKYINKYLFFFFFTFLKTDFVCVCLLV